jgi:molybdopterin converting factor subunit 1
MVIVAIHPHKHRAAPFSDGIARTSILQPVPETAICVHVRLFASYREAAGTNRLDTPLRSGARVRDLLELLSAQLPALVRAPGLVAVNHTYVSPDTELQDGDEVALIPPVSGGSR